MMLWSAHVDSSLFFPLHVRSNFTRSEGIWLSKPHVELDKDFKKEQDLDISE
jgi:hypothetical protein